MPDINQKTILEQFEEAAQAEMPERHVLRLYVAGSTGNSTRAIRNIQAICQEHLPGNHDLEIVDLYRQPEMAARDEIVAIPTLIKERPYPVRRVVGDLSNKERVMSGLGLRPHAENNGTT
jgi:circadian clock protein KaiB